MKRESILPQALTILVVAAMVGASELLGEQEIIFPEIAAIAVGLLLAPRRAWMTNRLRVFALIAVSASLGLAISVCVPLPLWAKLSAAFVLGQLLLICSGTGFAPLISAIVLPVLLGTRSLVYPAAAVALTAMILLMSLLLERLGVRKAEPDHPVGLPERRDFPRIALRTALGVLCIAAAVRLDVRFAAAPPLLVAFTELMNRESAARRRPFQAIALLSLCAALGVASRVVLAGWLGLPLTIAAAAAAAGMILLLRGFHMFLPPAGALTVLAMLIPESALGIYPTQVLLGSCAYMALAVLTNAADGALRRAGLHHT